MQGMGHLSPQPGVESALEGQVLTAKEAPPVLLRMTILKASR